MTEQEAYKKINDWHDKAIALAQQALDCKEHGDLKKFKELNAQAFKLEKKAFDYLAHELLPSGINAERKLAAVILSAGWMAFHAGRLKKALEMVEQGRKWELPDNDIQKDLHPLELRIYATQPALNTSNVIMTTVRGVTDKHTGKEPKILRFRSWAEMHNGLIGKVIGGIMDKNTVQEVINSQGFVELLLLPNGRFRFT